MKLFKFLFKPKWQHKDATIRRSAIESSSPHQATEMSANLPHLVRDDPDASVRKAALDRLNDFEIYRDRSISDPDEVLRRYARERYLSFIRENKISLDQQIEQLPKLETTEIEQITQTAITNELRLAALGHVKRQSIFIDRAINDTDNIVRQSALNKINESAALSRIAEKTRKTDKTISRLARERFEALQIAAGNPTVIRQRAEILCEQIESVVRHPGDNLALQLNQFNQAWDELGSTIPTELINRFSGARLMVERYLSPPPPLLTQTESENLSEIKQENFKENEQVQISVEVDTPVNPPNVSNAENDTSSNFSPDSTAPSDFIEQEREQQAKILAQKQQERELLRAKQEEFSSLLVSFEQSIENGDVKITRQQYEPIEALKTELQGHLPSFLFRRWEKAKDNYAKLIRWQRWSNNQRRAQLCEELEQLIGSGLHPDALAAKIRDARNEWRQLNIAEGLDNEERTSTLGLTKRFRAICHRVLKPARTYFEKRDELRRSHIEQIEALIVRYKEMPVDNVDWKAMRQLRTEGAALLRESDRIDPRVRGELTKQLKEAMTDLGKRLLTHEGEIEKDKSRLIQQAEALAQSEDLVAAARAVPDLQKRWKALGNGRRRTDQSQWETFHAACDAVFTKLTAQREQKAQADTERRAQAESILQQLTQLSERMTEEKNSLFQEMKNLEEQWENLAIEARDLRNQFRNKRDQILKQYENYRQEKRRQRFSHALDKYKLIRKVESGTLSVEEITAHWREIPAPLPLLEESLNVRFQALQNPPPSSENVDDPIEESEDPIDTARQLLVELEFLAKIESPESERQLRMDYQVMRLSDRMRNKHFTNLEEEFTHLLHHWLQLPVLPEKLQNGFEERFERAGKAILKQLP